MDDAGGEAARRWRAARKWAGGFALSFVALVSTLGTAWRETAQREAALSRDLAELSAGLSKLEAELRTGAEAPRPAEAEALRPRREEAAREAARREEREEAAREAEARQAAARWEEAAREAVRLRAEARPSEPRDGQSGKLASMVSIATALGTFTTGIGTVSALLLGWRAERRQAQEFQLKIRQLEHQVQELDAKKREEVRQA